MMIAPVTVLLENSMCSAATTSTMTNGCSTPGTSASRPSITCASQRAAPVSNTITPSDSPATIRTTPPQSMSRWASFHTSTRSPGRNSSKPPPSASACVGGSMSPPVSSASSGVASHVVIVPAKTAMVQIEALSPDGMSTEQQLDAIRVRTKRMMDDVEPCWSDVLRPLLASHRIRILDPADYTPAVEDFLQDHYRRNIHPVLTPLAFDPGHPFPFISNLSMNLAVVVERDGRMRFARVKLPDVLARFIPIPASIAGQPGDSFALLEDVVKLNVASLFPGVAVRETHLSASSATPTW